MAIREYIAKITDEVIPDGFERFENEYAPEGQLVLCKDCKFRGVKYKGGNLSCKKLPLGYSHEPDWFCADGERKEGR